MAFTLIRRIALAAAVLLFCLPGHLACRIAGRRSPWVRLFLQQAGRTFGIRVRVAGRPIPANVLYVANHLSWMDILAIGGATDSAFVSKDDVAGWPVIGWLARQGRTVFIRRADKADVHAQADALATALADGRPVTLFPEGTTGDGTRLLPFRAALLAALDRAPPGIVVQPIAIDYGAAANEVVWPDGEGAGANAKRLLSRPGTLPVTLRFLDPIDPAIGRKAIAAEARAAIEAALLPAGRLGYSPAP